jgi:polar amino acid transport system substrate-binding protein
MPPKELVASGTLTYGTAASFPPFEYQDPESGGITGFDIEMIEALAGYMGLEAEPLDIDFDGLVPALKGGRIDIINSAMYIKPEREEQVDFVRYMVIGEAIVVPAGNSEGVSALPDDLSELDVAVTRGAIGERYMLDFNEELESMGKPPMNIMTFPTNQDALLAVHSGRADAFDTSIPGAAHLNEERPGEFEVAATFDLGTEIGIATRKGDEDMQRAMSEALKMFVDDGGYAALLEKYGLPPAVNYFAQ